MKRIEPNPPVAFSAQQAEQLFREGSVLVFCINGQRSRHCVSAAEARQFFAERA